MPTKMPRANDGTGLEAPAPERPQGFRLAGGIARAFPGKLPRWADAALGSALLALGLVLITRPFASIDLLLILLGLAPIAVGIVEFLRREEWAGRFGWVRPVAASILIVLGLGILFFPGLTLVWAIGILGVALLVAGARDLITASWRRTPMRAWAQGLSGASMVVFGVLVFAWRDLTVLVVGALFGIWLLVTGIRLIIDAIRRGSSSAQVPTKMRREWPQLALGAGSLALAVLLAATGGRLLGTHPPDAFYTAPSTVPSEAGMLLRAEPFTRAIPEGATAWRILYTTSREDGVPAIASGLVIVPDGVADPPTIAWAHGTTGGAVDCAPTLLADPLTAGAMPDAAAALERGWAIVATDYLGLGADAPHPYLVGEAEGRSVLDAVRASRQLSGASFGEQVAVWGHSQGGGAALWTGGIAADYAPELNIVGVAAMAPAANLPAMIAELADAKAGTVVGPLVLAGFAASYDDVAVQDYLAPAATLLYQESVKRCWSDPSMLVSVLQAGLIDRTIWAQSPTSGALAARLEQNVPTREVAAPLLIAQGLDDTLVLPDAQQEYVDSRCAAGQSLDYRTYPGQDHMGVVSAGSPLLDELLSWTADRLAGVPATSTC